MLGFRQEVGQLAGVDFLLAGDALGQQFLAPRLEGAMQLGHQGQGVVGQDFFEPGMQRRVDAHALGQLSWSGFMAGSLDPWAGIKWEAYRILNSHGGTVMRSFIVAFFALFVGLSQSARADVALLVHGYIGKRRFVGVQRH